MDGQASCGQTRRTGDRGEDLADDGPKGFKKNEFKPHLSEYWKIPPHHDADLVLLATGAGLIGALIPYGIGRFGGSPLLERIMKRFSSMEKPILTSYRVFGNHEKSAVLVSRVIPLCRTYIGFVAGAMGQNISRYLLYSAIGIVTWNTVLTGLGYYFYQYKDLFFHYFDKYKHVIFYTGIVLLVIFALNAIRKKRAARETNQEE